jgi:dolichol-phosphate mannosyltransferase
MNTITITNCGTLTKQGVQTQIGLSIVVPTRNEAGNIELLLSRINDAVYPTPVEVIFVDDSADDTPQVIESVASKFTALGVRMIHRQPEERVGGLGGAVLEGLRVAEADYALIMDGDLQHPPELIPILLNAACEKDADLVVATRRSTDSQVSGLNTARNLISRVLDKAARVFFPRQLSGVTDPLTGFFLVRVGALDLDKLHPKGFKILLEILVRHPNLRKAEVPFHFGERHAGQSKASAKEAFRYLGLLWTMRFGEGSLRFLGFALVGLTGMLVNSWVLYMVTEQLRIHYLLSTPIATLASTLWNFVFIETLVYQAAKQKKGRMKRFGLFLMLNLAALAIRSPIIYVLTSVFGLFYVGSNLISLAVLTIIRFLLGDNFIWAGFSAQKNGQYEKTKTYSYNVHNVVSLVSEGVLPELEPFRVETEIQNPTIRVQVGIPRREKPGEAESGTYLYYHELFAHIGFEVGIEMGEQVKVTASPLLKLSPHVLYTNVIEPILRWTFVKKGYALVHGATIAFGNKAYMITARTDTGKTTTLLKILSRQRRLVDQAAFLSDDMTIVSPDGMAFTYPKPLTISAHTLQAVNSDTLTLKEKLILPFQSRIHSRSGRKVASVISRTHLPAATINMYVQMLIPPPKYTVQKLVPGAKLANTANLAGMFIIQRGNQGITPMENGNAMEILLKNCEDAYGFPPYDDVKEFLYFAGKTDLRVQEQAIIRGAVGALPATLISSSNFDWWCRIPPFVNEQVAKACTCDAQVKPTFQGEALGTAR